MEKPDTNIYLLYNQQWNPEIKNWDGKVVYVGISSVPHQAIKKQKASGKVFNAHGIIPCKNEDAQALKIKYLFLHHPKYNKTISISKTFCRLVGKTSPTENKKVSIPCVIIDNRLYGDFSGAGFDLKNSKRERK